MIFYNLYSRDGSHPSLEGSYLAACVLYSTMTERDPRQVMFAPNGMETDKQRQLQTVAYLTVNQVIICSDIYKAPDSISLNKSSNIDPH